jgi:hypothetical protein
MDCSFKQSEKRLSYSFDENLARKLDKLSPYFNNVNYDDWITVWGDGISLPHAEITVGQLKKVLAVVKRSNNYDVDSLVIEMGGWSNSLRLVPSYKSKRYMNIVGSKMI